MRVFLAVEVPDIIKKDLVGIQRDLRSRIPAVRWERPEKLHITLVFLGKVGEERAGELEEVVRKGVKGIKGIKGIRGLKGLKGVKDAGGFWVEEITIVESKLHPAGAVHTPIARIPLC